MRILDGNVKKVKIVVACDVNNTLCGKSGASYIFAPQKGATPKMVKTLDDNLGRMLPMHVGGFCVRI